VNAHSLSGPGVHVPSVARPVGKKRSHHRCDAPDAPAPLSAISQIPFEPAPVSCLRTTTPELRLSQPDCIMAPYSVLSFISNQFRTLPDVEPQDLSGRVVLVSGSNIGLGLEAARHFASMKPAKLILAVRDVKKGQAAAEDIVRSTSCSTIDVWAVDQTSFKSVKAFCDRVDKELDRLDMCVIL
jgi:hypothetical protein